MKKKVFSLMMTLLLAFIGVAKAEVVEIGDGTGTTYYFPIDNYFNYSCTEQIYLASEIGTAGTINSISFYYNYGTAYTAQNVTMYMKNVSRSSFSSTADCEPLALSDIVWSGQIAPTAAGWYTFTLDTPFQYDGTSNLLVAFFDGTSGYPGTSYTWRQTTAPGSANMGLRYYSDSTCPDPYNLSSYGGSKSMYTYRGNVQLDITAGGGGGETVEVTIGDPTSTSSSSYLPTYSLYEYSLTQQIYTADEIGVGGTINSLTMWLKNTSSYARNLNFYMKEVTESAFANTSAWVSMSSSDLVGSITLANGISDFTETTINLSTPFNYTGSGNLLLCVQDVTGSWSSGAYGNTMAANGNQALYAYRDGTVYDITNPGVSGYTLTSKNVVRLSITTAGGGGNEFVDHLHVKYLAGEEEIIDSLNLGVRPINAWMEPFEFTMYTDGPAYTVTHLDFTPSDGMFSVEGEELPFEVVRNQDVNLIMSTNATQAGLVERQFVAITEGDRAAHIWPVIVEMYDPQVPDVWEKACTHATTFPFVEVPATAHNTTLHNDYDLPFDEIEEGYDAVYKLEFANDMVLNAEVTQGENGKVALYTEDFYGEGGPMATNNYNGPLSGAGGASATPFEAQIGEGTSTTGYFPFYTLYNYTISENLFLATELAEAGVTTAPMTSLSWYATNAPGYAQQGITIWMANVEDAALTTTSHIVTNMTKVYTGAMTPAIGWNEFVFNEGTFSWDGHSNVLIFCQRNNGAWNSTVNWQATTSLPFDAMAYRYQDSGAYDPTVANTMYTSTTRPNIIMKSARGSRADRELITIGEGTATTNVYPTQATYNYCFNEMIYPAASIGTAGTISSIGFHFNGANVLSRNVVVYMKNVTRSSFASTTDWEAVTASDIVYTGTLSSDAVDQWVTLTLDAPFYYDGTSNLMIAFDDNTGTWNSRYWYYTAGADNCCMTRYYDGGDVDPYNPGTASNRHNTLPNLQLEMTAGGAAGNIAYGPVITDAPVAAGTYYLVASSTDEDFEVTINAQAMPCPTVDGFAFNPMPADNEDEIEPASVTLQWMNPANATEYQVVFGSTYHPEANHPQTVISDWTPVTGPTGSFTVRNLWNNTNYFWHVVFRNNGACTQGVSSPIWGFTTNLNIPQNLVAVDETVFNDEQIVLNWNAVVDRTFRTYFIYRDGVKVGETTTNNIGNTSFTDGPLPYNMAGYTYYVTAIYDEGESAPSNTVNVKVSGYGDVNGHVYEMDGTTGIAGATVTMVGQDEFGVNHTYNFITDGTGYYSGHIYAGSYNGSAACNGYQTIDAPVQGNPIAIDYNQTTSPIDYILDENFDAPCTVIAEYYPDSLDPESPYVKVYWGCGLPGEEIIEPFETGDFSAFDWQLDPTYPWSITTNNPYEGTYCMKSGGAGVANVVSNMTVTVDIPADGDMSFFGKISCEQNWDYGYFFIDGQQMGSYTGAGSWGERRFGITAGTHTFQWRYTKDGSVNSNDDCFYVDYITFYKRPEPLGAGWHTFLEGEFNDALRSNVSDQPSFAYHYPASLTTQYNGFTLTKVSMFSDDLYGAVGGNYTCYIYEGGSTPGAGTLVSTQAVSLPVGLGDWVDWDLTTPVPVHGGTDLWVVWHVDQAAGMGYPAGMCNSDSNPNGDWWDGGEGWENYGGGVWTMRNYFNNRSGRGFYDYASETAPVAIAANSPINSNLRTYVKGDNTVTSESINPNAPSTPLRMENSARILHHYNIYRTNCYNDGPYTAENTVLLATSWPYDTVYIDVEWADLPAGVYKWGVGAVYQGNRGEMIESPISWAAPQNVTRSATADNDPNPVAGSEGIRAPWDLITTFTAPEAAQYGVVTDGQYIYTSNWGYASAAHNFYKYDMQGNMIEGFEIPGCGTLRGMTFDGQHVYGVANSSTVYCVDLNSHTLVNTFTSAYGAMRGITYDPERDGFWVIGNWSGDLTLINRSGAIVTTGPTPTSVSDLAYYKDENDVEHVFCFNNGDNGVYDYNITTNTLGGSVFNFNAVPGFDAGTSGGCHVAEYNGVVAFFGDMQQDPNLIGIYELRSGGVGPTPEPGTGNLNELAEPRESETIWSNCLDKDMYLAADDVTINVLLNSADSPEGVNVTFTNYNEGEQELYGGYELVLDETGFYAFDTFRKGEYKVEITFDGYEPITDSVSIWEARDLRYVMTEIIYGVDNLYVSSTGWAMWDPQGAAPGPQPGPGGAATTFSVGFEEGMPEGWTKIDANNDGNKWEMTSDIPTAWPYYASLTLDWYRTGTNAICSGSYINGVGAITPDDYLVTPQVTLAAGSTFSFWAAATDASYPADHFGVFVSDNGTSDWTEVQSWTLTAKGGSKAGDLRASRDGNGNRLGSWHQYSVDLSAFAGQKYIAIRHFNCYDQYIMCVDDIELTAGRESGDRHLEYFKVMCESLDHEPIFNADVPAERPFCQVNTDELVAGEHYICKVAAVYSTGMSAWAECEWQYIPCTEYAGTVDGVTIEGNTISWTYPGGGPVPPQPGQGSTFSENCDNGMPAGWTNVDADGDGFIWVSSMTPGNYHNAGVDLTGNGHNASAHFVLSGSWANGTGTVLYPDNYLVSPQVTLVNGSTFSFWACAQDAAYPADHFGVFISDNGTSDWTMVNEWTMTAKNGGNVMSAGRGGEVRAQGNWYNYSVDLSAFAGQKYIAIRHFNCSDQFILNVDDIELTVGAKSNRDVIFDQAQFVTDPGVMPGGADASWTKGGQATWGPNGNNGGGYILADDFTLTGTSTINEIECYAYQTGSSTTSTFTGMYVQIYNGNPMSGGQVVWGDQTTNIMTSTAWTNCYRGSDGETTATTRPIMSVTASNLNINLEAGTYYIGVSFTGTLSSGPWGAIQAVPGTGNTGNGVQYTSTGWTTLLDGGTNEPYGIPFKLSGGGTGPTPTPGEGNVLGAMIFADGEWEAFVEYPTNSYVYEGEAEEVCVRMVYDGTNTLPEGNIYFSMSCPECEPWNPVAVCEPGEPIHSELVDANHIKVWWGNAPAAPISEWLYYDDGTYATSVGVNDASAPIYWATMFPAASLAPYAGTNLTKVAVYTIASSYNNPMTVTIHLGGTTAPGTAYSTTTFTPSVEADFEEVTMDPVAIDGTQNLWIVVSQAGTYPAQACADTGDPNNRWVSLNGTTWQDLANAGLPGYGWLLRGFVTNQAKGVENTPIEVSYEGGANGTLSHTEVVSMPAPMAFMNRAELVKYNVYRSTEANGTYTLIGEVAETGADYYEYIDSPTEAGTYYYQVRAYYSNDCESEPAQAFDNPAVNYVSETTTIIGVDENSDNVALYPNPTKGNVTIEAAGMSRITVVSVLGQVVFDTELSADNYTLNMSQFNAGMYMVRVYTETGVTVKRVTVMQ